MPPGENLCGVLAIAVAKYSALVPKASLVRVLLFLVSLYDKGLLACECDACQLMCVYVMLHYAEG
jgi:hypothetical protein